MHVEICTPKTIQSNLCTLCWQKRTINGATPISTGFVVLGYIRKPWLTKHSVHKESLPARELQKLKLAIKSLLHVARDLLS